MATSDNQNINKDPDDWVTGDDPATDSQKVYLETLANQAGEPSPSDDINKAQASKRIDELRDETGLDETRDISTEQDPDISNKDIDG